MHLGIQQLCGGKHHIHSETANCKVCSAPQPSFCDLSSTVTALGSVGSGWEEEPTPEHVGGSRSPLGCPVLCLDLANCLGP